MAKQKLKKPENKMKITSRSKTMWTSNEFKIIQHYERNVETEKY